MGMVNHFQAMAMVENKIEEATILGEHYQETIRFVFDIVF
jgi:hypothetical protein